MIPFSTTPVGRPAVSAPWQGAPPPRFVDLPTRQALSRADADVTRDGRPCLTVTRAVQATGVGWQYLAQGIKHGLLPVVRVLPSVESGLGADAGRRATSLLLPLDGLRLWLQAGQPDRPAPDTLAASAGARILAGWDVQRVTAWVDARTAEARLPRSFQGVLARGAIHRWIGTGTPGVTTEDTVFGALARGSDLRAVPEEYWSLRAAILRAGSAEDVRLDRGLSPSRMNALIAGGLKAVWAASLRAHGAGGGGIPLTHGLLRHNVSPRPAAAPRPAPRPAAIAQTDMVPA